MRSGKGIIYKRENGVWRIGMELPRDPETGKRRRITKSVRGSKKKAEEALMRLLAENGEMPADGFGVTLDDFFDLHYMPRARANCRPDTYENYMGDYNRYWRDELGSIAITAITPAVVERRLNALDGSKKRFGAFKILRQVLNHAVRLNMLRFNPLNNMYVPKVERYRPEVLTAEQAAMMLEHFRGHSVEAAVLVALGGGLRRSEIAALDWQDITPEGIVTVDNAITTVHGRAYEDRPKSDNSTRRVALPAFAIDRLNELRPDDGETPLLLDTQLGRMHPETISHRYRDHLKTAPEELPRIQFKNLRHTSLTLVFQGGADLLTVSRRAGHSGTGITAHYYLRPDSSVDEAAARGLDALLGSRLAPIGTRNEGKEQESQPRNAF